jgi:hypothetical protein
MPKIQYWPDELVAKINRIQFHSLDHHPLTCPHRSEAGHEYNGRDLAILVAKPEGYLECPFCGYQQEWIPDGFVRTSAQKEVLKPKENSKSQHYEAPKKPEYSKDHILDCAQKYIKIQERNAQLMGVSYDEWIGYNDDPIMALMDVSDKTPPVDDEGNLLGWYKQSALMVRLLEGIEPLPFPPPRAGSHCWYSLIEKSDPQPVRLGIGLSTIAALASYAGAHQKKQLFVAGNGWEIVSANEAALDFLKLQEEPWVEIDGKTVRPDGWIENALKVAFSNPEFVVKDRFYGEFKVWYSLDVVTGHNGRRYAFCYKTNKEILEEDWATDLRGVNPKVAEVVHAFSTDDILTPIEAVNIDLIGELSEEDLRLVKEYREKYLEHRPELDHDWVSVKEGSWLIQKC